MSPFRKKVLSALHVLYGLLAVTYLFSTSGLARAGDATVTLQSLLAEMTDRDAIARLPSPHFVWKQASSYDRAETDPNNPKTWFANHDRDQFLRTETNEGRKEWVIMDDHGPGCIVRFWHPLRKQDSDGIVRFYFDGAKTPGITANFSKLLSGQSFVPPPFSFVASEHPAGRAGDLYLPIPFAKACKITVSKSPFYYNINYRAYDRGARVLTFTMKRFAAAAGALHAAAQRLAGPLDAVEGKPASTHGQLEPGKELSLTPGAGPAAIGLIQVRVNPKDAEQALRSIVLKADFDGQPTVWCPLSEFFGCGVHLEPVHDWDRSVNPDGTLTAAWVMPYRTSARLALENMGPTPVAAALTVKTGPWQWDDRSMYFHAGWRSQRGIQTKLRTGTMDWNYIKMTGCGVYVGDTLTVMNESPKWFGEGDERVYMDGEKFPSQLGTGTEDYYGYAWGMAQQFSSPFISMPKREHPYADRSGCTTTSRMRLLDGIPVRKSLRFDMEIWHWAATKVDYTVGVFWYGRPGATSNRDPLAD